MTYRVSEIVIRLEVYTSRMMKMSRKMTVVFHDEDPYTYLKVEAARRHMPASARIAQVVSEWLEPGPNTN